MSEAKYTFLPWMRRGLASQLAKLDHLGKDATQGNDTAIPAFDLNLSLLGQEIAPFANPLPDEAILQKQIKLFSPGDIVGIENRAIIKTEPPKGNRDFEPNYLPYIDFYEEDFCWRYSPTAPNNDRLRPWLALVVLTAQEFSLEPMNTNLPLQILKINTDLENIPFPDPYQLWAWAHVHVNRPVNQDLANVISNNPNLACSRLIAPRKLLPETQYFAFLIPSFERGRLAGLNAPLNAINATDIQLAAWGHPQDHFEGFTAFLKRFPIYFQWSFHTGKIGEDFESLAKRIVPTKLDPNVGKRLIDVQTPGYNINFQGGETGEPGTLSMYGALRHPDAAPENMLEKISEDTDKKDLVEDIAALINLEKDLLKDDWLPVDNKYYSNPYFNEDAGSIYDDPIITPPIYGRWHAKQDEVNSANKNNWVDQLNLDPRHRLAAGLGAEVVRRNQEEYMERAWNQFGELFPVNSLLNQTALFTNLNEQLYQKHFIPLPPASVIQTTAAGHKTVRINASKSFRKEAAQYNFPQGVFSSAYNRMARPNGALMKRVIATSSTPSSGGNPMSGVIRLEMSNFRNFTVRQVFPVLLQPVIWSFIGTAISRIDDPETIPNWKKRALENNGVTGFRTQLVNVVSVTLDPFKKALEKLQPYFSVGKWSIPHSQPEAQLDILSANLLFNMRPRLIFAKKLNTQLRNFNIAIPNNTDQLEFKPVLAHPVFNDATYEEILRLSLDNFVPNLDLVPPNSFSTMETNRPFIEAYLMGLNHELARELLWREFPTDQRGTYFSCFWDKYSINFQSSSPSADIQPIHDWKTDKGLGEHPQPGTETEKLVVVLRSDLLNRYPNALIYLEKANADRQLSGQKIEPIFEAKVEPDIFFLGFDKTKEQVLSGSGYFFVIQERPGEVHFGLDSESQEFSQILSSWDDLNWGHIPNVNTHINLNTDIPPTPSSTDNCFWGKGQGSENSDDPAAGNGTAADMACILYQNPVRIAIHANDLLTD